MAKLKIYSDIVGNEEKAFLAWNGLDAIAFADVDAFIASIPAEDEAIDLAINCRGGLTDAALAMYDALRASGKVISADVIGECSSSATLLLLAARADLRRAHPNARILIHNPYIAGYVEGDAKRVGAIAGELEAIRNQFLDIYVERTGASRETLAAIMDENKPMSVERAKELGFISDIIVPISAKNKPTDMNKKRIWKAFGKLLGVYGMSLDTADGKTLELQKESGEPVVGDEVVSDDGEYLLPDGRTVVVESGVITEIRPAEETATEEAVEEEAAERGEETADGDEEQRETDSDKDAEIDRLKAEIAEKDAEIDRLRRELESAQANAKSEADGEVLAMVETAGGIEWLKNVRSNAVVAQRETSTANAERANEKRTERVGFAEYMANRRKK